MCAVNQSWESSISCKDCLRWWWLGVCRWDRWISLFRPAEPQSFLCGSSSGECQSTVTTPDKIDNVYCVMNVPMWLGRFVFFLPDKCGVSETSLPSNPGNRINQQCKLRWNTPK